MFKVGDRVKFIGTEHASDNYLGMVGVVTELSEWDEGPQVHLQIDVVGGRETCALDVDVELVVREPMPPASKDTLLKQITNLLKKITYGARD